MRIRNFLEVAIFKMFAIQGMQENFLFYSGDPKALIGTDEVVGAYYAFPSEYVFIRKKENENLDKSLPLEVRPGFIPKEAMWSTVSFHTIFYTFWAENFGHAIFDDVFPLYRLIYHLGVANSIKRNIKVWQPVLCNHFFQNNAPYGDRACRFIKAGLKAFTDLPLGVLGTGELSSKSLVCVQHLLAGTATLGMMYERDFLFRPFVNDFITNFAGMTILASAPKDQHVLYVLKTGRRSPIHLQTAATQIKYNLGVQTSLIRPETMTLAQQIEYARNATVVVSPCGGISFLTAFMAPSTTRIIIDYFDVTLNHTGKMESFIWQYDYSVKTFHYPIDIEEVRLPDEYINSGENAWLIYRNYGQVNVSVSKLQPLVEQGLIYAEDNLRNK